MSNINFSKLIDAEKRGELVEYVLTLDFFSRENDSIAVLTETHNAGHINICSDQNIYAIEKLPSNDFFRILHTFNEAIPLLKCNALEILRFVQSLVKKSGTDMMATQPYQSLAVWCRNNKTKAEEIINNSLNNDPKYLPYLTYAVVGIEDSKTAFHLALDDKEPNVQVGFRSLGSIKSEEIGFLKSVIDHCISAIEKHEHLETRAEIIRAAFRTWEKFEEDCKDYRQSEFINFLVSAKSDDDLVQLSAMLFYHSDGIIKSTEESVIRALADASDHHKKILHWFDKSLLRNAGEWDFDLMAKTFRIQLGRINEVVDYDIFKNFADLAWKDKANSSKVISSWFNEGELRSCQFISDSINILSNNNVRADILKKDLPSDTNEQIFIAHKCVGYFYHHPITAATILLSIVKNGKKPAQLEAEELLFDPMLLSYSGELKEFLKSEKINKSIRVSRCIKRTISKHNKYLKGLRLAQEVIELTPSNNQRRIAATREREANNRIQKNARERSFFTSFMTMQVLLYGRKSFSVVEGPDGIKTPNVIPMAEHSYSTEFPRLAVVDPIGLDRTITHFQLERKDARETDT